MTSRRQFLVRLVGAAALPVLPSVAGCGDDAGDPPDRDAGRDSGSDSGSNDSGTVEPDADVAKTCATSSATIGSNHGHTLAVAMSDVVAGVDKTFTTGGTMLHTHTVLVTSADFTTLAAGGSVTKTSSDPSAGGAHTHSVTIVCLT